MSSRPSPVCRLSALPGLLLLLGACAAPGRIELRLGFDERGVASDGWKAAIAARGEGERSWERRPLTPAESEWLALVRAGLPAWEERLPALAVPFEGVAPPRTVVLLVGNQNGEDAFVLGGDTVHLDLAALLGHYGAASEPENAARLERFFAHEYTHVLHTRWERAHPEPLDT